MLSRPRDSRFVSLSVRAYHALLGLYPGPHRRAYGPLMAQLFRDQCRRAAATRGTLGLANLWGHTLGDLTTTLLLEWRSSVQEKNLTPILAGAALLLIPATFAATNLLYYGLGIESVPLPLNAVHEAAGPLRLQWLFDAVILLSPPVAAALNLRPVLRGIQLKPGEDTLASLAITRANLGAVVVAGFAALLVAVFALYFLSENWQCLVGAAVSC